MYHPPFDLTFYCDLASAAGLPPPTYNYPKGDYYGLYVFLRDSDWSPITTATDVDACVTYLTSRVRSAMDVCIPLHQRRPNRASRYPAWFSGTLVGTLQRKDYYHRTYKRTKDPTDLSHYRELRTTASTLLAADKRNLASATRDEALQDPKTFWGLVNSKLKGKPATIVLKRDDLLISHPSDMAEMFAKYFATIAMDKATADFQLPTPAADTPLHNLEITEAEVYHAIKTLGSKFTTGSDGIPGFVIKGCGDLLLPLLVRIFNLSLSTGVFPRAWKTALITPIFKKGFAGDVKNYRPISLLCVLAKIFDRLMHGKLYQWFRPHLSDTQHGFISGRSVESNLVSFLGEITPYVEGQGQVDVVYLDLAKAFDRVSHPRLLAKLSHYGVSGSLLRWIADYLHNRTNTLKINGTITDSSFITTCGVPQGSSLGPLMFNIYANDLPLCLAHSSIYQFADDGKTCKTIRSVTDCSQLQSDLLRLHSWCEANNIPINPDKSAIITFTRKTAPLLYPYRINGHLIDRLACTRDLGVLVDSGLRFGEHVAHTVSVCRRSLGMSLKLARMLRSKATFRQLYLALVRSRALFGSVAWGGCSAYLRFKLEAVQRKFVELRHTHFSPNDHYDYHSLLRGMELHTLSTVMKQSELLFLRKLIRGTISSPGLLALVNLHVPSHSVRHVPVFHASASGLNPISRVQQVANSYSSVIDIFSCGVSDIKRLV